MTTFNVRSYFEGLELQDWEYTGSLNNRSTGQAAVIQVQRGVSDKGVFRCLKDQDPKAMTRFDRELRILTTPEFRHPAIVEILAFTTDPSSAPWYVSRLGLSFTDFWNNKRKVLLDEPDRLVLLAVEFIKHLCAGLGPLHDRNIVHRDIKPANIVIVPGTNGDRPALIDFGLAYADDEIRLTDVNEAVGNRAFSHDSMMRRGDEVPPWLDVFQLAQLLMWMVEPSKRKWSRPVHWAHNIYAPGLTEMMGRSIRAATASCSVQACSPRNADELRQLLIRLFPDPASVSVDRAAPAIDSIQIGMAKGEASKALRAAEHQERIESNLPLFCCVYSGLENVMRQLQEGPGSPMYTVELVHDGLPEECVPPRATRNIKVSSLASLVVRASNGKSFQISLKAAYLPTGESSNATHTPPEAANPYVFRVGLGGHERTEGRFIGRNRYIWFDRTGALTLCHPDFSNGKNMTLSEIRDLLESWIVDEDVWLALYDHE
jgi:hypothetical protein